MRTTHGPSSSSWSPRLGTATTAAWPRRLSDRFRPQSLIDTGEAISRPVNYRTESHPHCSRRRSLVHVSTCTADKSGIARRDVQSQMRLHSPCGSDAHQGQKTLDLSCWQRPYRLHARQASRRVILFLLSQAIMTWILFQPQRHYVSKKGGGGAWARTMDTRIMIPLL